MFAFDFGFGVRGENGVQRRSQRVYAIRLYCRAWVHVNGKALTKCIISSLRLYLHHPGELVAKVGYFGVKLAKVYRVQMGTKPAIKSVALALTWPPVC